MNLDYHIRSLHEAHKEGKVDADAKVILEEIKKIKAKSALDRNKESYIEDYINVLEQYISTDSMKLRKALAYASDYLSEKLFELKVF
ncbi:hypothetical protein H7397_001488 [Salmonella enterica]|nr:hypothetical protein [Salmonella enterica]EGY5214450.1 hypothetical protein [Salmonella enterica]